MDMPNNGEIIRDLAERLAKQVILTALKECKTLQDFESVRDQLEAQLKAQLDVQHDKK